MLYTIKKKDRNRINYNRFNRVVFGALIIGEAINLSLTFQYFSDLFQTLFNRNNNSLEWCINSPPKPHAFISLPRINIIDWMVP